jgi:hypothetical protein
MAEITEKILEIKAKVEGETTVKDLKEQIAELTQLMDTLDKESTEYTDTVNLLVNAEEKLTNAMKVGKSQLSAQEGSYNSLVNRMAALKKAHKAVTDETTRNRLSEEINNINTQLKEMDANNGVYVRNVGNYENAIKEALKTPQQELKALRLELAQLEEGTEEYNAVFTRMAQLTHDVTEQQEQLKWSSADLGDILGNVSGVATSLAGGFSAVSALGGLIGGESEELEEAMLQTQRFIQLIQGLEQFEQLADKVKGLWKGIKDYASALKTTNAEQTANTASTIANTTATASNATANATNTSATATNTTATQANTAATNAQSAANVTATATTGAFSVALGVLKTALIATGIGVIVVALGALVNLLGEGLGKVWDWVTGADKANEQTETLQNSFKGLEERLGEQDKAWERQEALMKAQGKSYEEIYEAHKKYLKGKLAEVQAFLATQQAIAKDIGQRKLQKKQYDDFRKTLEEVTEKEKQLKQAINELEHDKHVKDVEEETKRTNELAEAKKKAAEAAQEAHKKEKESAEKLYKDLVQFYKDEKTKLKEKYEEEKKLLEKFGQDTTLLTKKYEEDKTNIVLKEEESRKKLREQFQRNLDDSFRYPSIEYFDNQLTNATEKLEDFQRVASTIKIDEQGFKSAENWNENIQELTDNYGVSIQSFEDFENVLKRVQLDYEDAKKELEDYEYQSSTEDIDKRVEKLNALTEFETRQKEQEYELYLSQEKSVFEFTNNSITQMHKRWETEDAIYQLRKGKLEEELALIKEQANQEGISASTKTKLLADAAEIEKKIALEEADYTIAQNERKKESFNTYVTAFKDSFSGVGDILGTVADAWETSIKAEVDAGRMSQEEADEKMEEVKKIQSAQALINTFSSAVSAYQSMAGIPFVGPALGAAAAAAAIASGLAQVKAINAVKKGDKGGGGSSTRYAEVTPTVPSDFTPQAVTNVTGGQETENLANALGKAPLKAYVVESEITSTQQKVAKRNQETSF